MGLRGYVIKRTINTIILVLFTVTLNFIIFQLIPGEQGSIQAFTSPGHIPDPKIIDQLRQQYGYYDPLPVRYFKYMEALFTFKFGFSYDTGKYVIDDFNNSGRLYNTLTLLGVSTLLALVIGVFLGVYTARKRGKPFDSFWVSASLVTYSLPTFWIGLVLILIFAIGLHWFPTGGVIPFEWINAASRPDLATQIVVRMQHLFLPALTLTLFSYGGFLLLARATMIETLTEDYITTARAKGLSERTILFKHALKNASLPIVTSAALNFGFILSGAIITETVFNWNGLGLWIWQAINFKDYPVMQFIFFIGALTVIAANFISDLMYGWLDPRIKYD